MLPKQVKKSSVRVFFSAEFDNLETNVRKKLVFKFVTTVKNKLIKNLICFCVGSNFLADFCTPMMTYFKLLKISAFERVVSNAYTVHWGP